MNRIAIIGGGNLGQAIAEGLIASGFMQPEQITITRRNTAALAHLQERGIAVTSDNATAVADVQWVLFAVKPFQIQDILNSLRPQLDPKQHAIISVMTGISLQDLQGLTDPAYTVFRAMPNTAIAIKESITCLSAAHASAAQIDFVTHLFNQLGIATMIEDQLMDAATVLGACGTAYAMRYIRANIQGGIEIGFDARTAALIAAQTVKGAAELLLQRHTHPEQEIDKVTTPKGCTIAGLNEMEHQGFSSSLIKGIVTSYKKIKNDM
ncbi:Pyrroline-5-carboxylate reductase [compost metagenome]